MNKKKVQELKEYLPYFNDNLLPVKNNAKQSINPYKGKLRKFKKLYTRGLVQL